MCKECAEHAKKAWYLDEKNHSLESQGVVKDLLNWKILDFLDISAKVMFSKNTSSRLNPVIANFLDSFAKNVHGGQVIHDLQIVFELIDMAKDIGVSYCICKIGAVPQEQLDFKCILLNSYARIMRKDHPDRIKFITKEEAKRLVVERRKQGCYQSVFWGANPNVSILCNCDQNCGGLKFEQLVWTQVPAFSRIDVVNQSKCEKCESCVKVCYVGALKIGLKGVEVDAEKCRGCGLCKDRCPEKKVLDFVPRETYYDPALKRKVDRRIEGGVIHYGNSIKQSSH